MSSHKLAKRQSVKRRKLLLIKIDMLGLLIEMHEASDLAEGIAIYHKHSYLADLYNRVLATPAKIMRPDKFAIDKRRARRYSLAKRGAKTKCNLLSLS